MKKAAITDEGIREGSPESMTLEPVWETLCSLGEGKKKSVIGKDGVCVKTGS